MKLALVVPGGVDRSGEVRVIPALLALISRLASRNELHVYALAQEPEAGQWELAGARVHNIGRGSTHLRAIRAVCREHRKSPFNLIHSLWSGSPGFVAMIAARLLSVPYLIHVAGGELVALQDIGYGGSMRMRGRLREIVQLRAASAVTAASQPMLRLIGALGVSAQRVPLGVDTQVWPPRPPARRQPGAIARLIHVASLNRVKDQASLLKALANLAASGQRFHLDVVGDDTLNGEIQRLAAALGLGERVSFRGFLTQRQLRPVMEAADLLVMSSRHEAGPVALLEAAVAGVPAVGTAVGHFAEWAPEAAVSVPAGDAAALAAAIARVLGDDGLRMQLAGAAQQRALAEDADYTARTFEALYARLGYVR
jgi:glycosyltransferase involved in cell wall biosynthesis